MKLHHPLCVLLAASLVGCAPALDEGGEPVPVVITEAGEGELVGVQPLEPDNRDRRRLDLDQINASLRAATGYGWVDDEGNDHLVRLASTLGRADYRTNTAEDRSPSLVFQKFLSDAAHSVCGKVVSQDASRPAAERIFFLEAQASDTVASAPEAVEANIKQLLMRFHSRDVELGSDTLDAWMWMHESASFVSPNPQLAWNAVCVGLITHPDFYSY